MDNKKVLGKSLNDLFKENRVENIKGLDLKPEKAKNNLTKIKDKNYTFNFK